MLFLFNLLKNVWIWTIFEAFISQIRTFYYKDNFLKLEWVIIMNIFFLKSIIRLAPFTSLLVYPRLLEPQRICFSRSDWGILKNGDISWILAWKSWSDPAKLKYASWVMKWTISLAALRLGSHRGLVHDFIYLFLYYI